MKRPRPQRDKSSIYQATTNCSKRLRGNADINIHSLTGWRNLPWELQKSILVSRALSLGDLAKLAPLGKVFKEAYLERCTEDEQWMEHAAISVFGAQAVDALVCWVSSPKRDDDPAGLNPLPPVLELSEGESWPDLRSMRLNQNTAVQQPACFLPGDLKNLIWIFDYSLNWRRREISMWEGTQNGRAILSIEFHGRQLGCFMQPRVPAHVLPCLGLVHLACKKAAESFGWWSNDVPPQYCRSGFVGVFGREGQLKANWPLNNVRGVPPDAQRAFTAISMGIWNSGRRNFWLNMKWQGRRLDRFKRRLDRCRRKKNG
eukprot:jgi/Botrbrau1/16579/Bobra.0068s0010.1